MAKRIFVLILLSVLIGCASVHVQPPDKQSFEKSRSYPLSYEKVWISAVDWFADHDVAIEKIEKSSGLLTAKYLIEASDEYLDCGDIKTVSIYNTKIDKYGSLNITVRSIDQNTTKVKVNFFGEFKLNGKDLWTEKTVTSNGRCISTGKLEKSILEYINREHRRERREDFKEQRKEKLNQANMHNELKTKSAVLGADAVILTEEGFVGGGTKDSLLLKYWATGVVVKYE